MGKKPIYVEIDIRTEMDALWKHTQDPGMHRQWDLRFSDIDYLPRESESEPQRFRYRTRIGFGLDIAGTGVSRATGASEAGERLSTLSFESGQAISLIRRGGGYWKYRPNGDRITFLTRYDYETRFGATGRLFDRLIFRPLFGWATAWSFDLLRIWLERRIPPAVTIQRAWMHYMSVALLSLLWIYEGLVPKLMFPEAGEMEMLRGTGLFAGSETAAVTALGVLELGAGLLLTLRHRSPRMHYLMSGLVLMLVSAGIAGAPETLCMPFNPLTVSLPMIALGLTAAWTCRDLPDAGRCRRRPATTDTENDNVINDNGNTAERGGDRHGVDLRASVGP